jgi:hypothetical protein
MVIDAAFYAAGDRFEQEQRNHLLPDPEYDM